MKVITEQGIKVKVTEPKKDLHKKLPVFYNPVMKSNRNLSVLLLNSIVRQEYGRSVRPAGELALKSEGFSKLKSNLFLTG